MGIALQTMTNELTHVFLLSVGAFLLAMFLTPIYTFFAYRYRFWGLELIRAFRRQDIFQRRLTTRFLLSWEKRLVLLA
jgi:hypothetical protein